MELPFGVNNNETIVVAKQTYSDMLTFILFFPKSANIVFETKKIY